MASVATDLISRGLSDTSAPANRPLRVGFSELHGMAHELCQFPPEGVFCSEVVGRPVRLSPIRSGIKGYMRRCESAEHDVIEAVISPIVTRNNWVYSVECMQAAMSFSLLGCPLPRSVRAAWFRRLLLQPNLKKIVFWSQAGRRTLESYAGIRDERIVRKATVVYPAIRRVSDELIRFSDGDVQILFSGDFFRKGGVHVVEAFERAQEQYRGIRLRLCCDEKIDFSTRDAALRDEFLGRIRRNPGIVFGRVPRDEMIRQVLPATDIYALPTYVETFGFALLEAMAFGIPVISTNHFAIPEIVEHGECGFLIDTRRFDCERLFRGYRVDAIPRGFREYMTGEVYLRLCELIESVDLRRRLGTAGVQIARTKFSLDARNERMLGIYREAVGEAA